MWKEHTQIDGVPVRIEGVYPNKNSILKQNASVTSEYSVILTLITDVTLCCRSTMSGYTTPVLNLSRIIASQGTCIVRAAHPQLVIGTMQQSNSLG